jgi:hypothetical protein
MDKMVPPDSHRISIPHDHNYFQVRLRQLYTGGKGKGAPMGRMERIEIDVHGQSPGAADAGYKHHFILLIANAIYGPDQGTQHDPYPAARTPYVRKLFVMA